MNFESERDKLQQSCLAHVQTGHFCGLLSILIILLVFCPCFQKSVFFFEKMDLYNPFLLKNLSVTVEISGIKITPSTLFLPLSNLI